MAQFNTAKTVNNILSGSSGTAQENIGNVIRTTTDLTDLPAIDVANLANLPGVADALRMGPDLGGKLGLGAPKGRKPKPKKIERGLFNPFSLADTGRAVAMATKLMEIAESKGGDEGIADAIGVVGSLGELLGEVSGLAGDLVGDLTAEVGEVVNAIGVDALGLMGLRQHALQLFITHYPPAREKFAVEPFEQQQPNVVRRSPVGATPPEDRVSYWREDVQQNEHHGHWHLVNPVAGRPVPGGIPDMGDRHGELFVYMHEQMLARYDAERIGADLPRVVPFNDYRADIPEGYDPGDLMVWNGERWVGFSARPPNARIQDLAPPLPVFLTDAPGAKLADMERFRDALLEAARQGRYRIGQEQITVTSDNLGNTVEANRLSVDYPVKDDMFDPANGRNYGDLHGMGHVHFAYYNNDPGPPVGVLNNLDATARDPIFWRWHKHVDLINQTWRQTLGNREPHDFDEGLPVTVRSEDIILCPEDGLPDKEGLPADYDDRRLGAVAFGYSQDANLNQWDKDFSSGTTTFTVTLGQNNSLEKELTTTAELMTEMRKRTIQVYDPDTQQMKPEEIDYLSHEDFYYFIRLQNRSGQAQQVTVRIFLAPESEIDDNTSWIEMDRFLHRLGGNEHTVIFRPSRLSAVIRKPALGHKELESTEPRPPATNWCDCGWPYNLLLPRGTKEGLDFRLLVMLSSNDLVMTDTGQECTSVSYCGLQDNNYPDRRPMGYPFDRSLPDGIDSIIDKHQNWASRAIKIRCRSL